MTINRLNERVVRDVDDLADLAIDVLEEFWTLPVNYPLLRKSQSVLGDVLLMGDYVIDGDPLGGWSVSVREPGRNPPLDREEIYMVATDALKAALAMAHEDWLDRRIAAALEKGGGVGGPAGGRVGGD